MIYLFRHRFGFAVMSEDVVIEKHWFPKRDEVDVRVLKVACISIVEEECAAVGTPTYLKRAVILLDQCSLLALLVYKRHGSCFAWSSDQDPAAIRRGNRFNLVC